ncbi:MAG: NAD-dependent epimerase/dehydratase family protein [Candidatus Falkowbacteria bacterium]
MTEEKSMSKILVTGGAGFIGSNLVDELVKLGHKVSVIDNLFTGKKEYLNPKAKFYKTDICSPAISKIFKHEKFDYVFHLAAQIDVRISVVNPELDNKINVLGAINVLKNCYDYKVKKIIFSSTGGAIYGEAKQVPTKEDYPADPVSPYGIHKLTFEKYLNYYYQVYGQKYAALRLANVYGPRQYRGGEAGVISIFIDNAVNNKPSQVNGDGKQIRDYVYIDDIVNALVSAMKTDYIGVINIGTAKEIDLWQTIKCIEKSTGEKFNYKCMPAKLGEQRRSSLNFNLAKKILKWQPKMQLEEGVKKTIVWSKNK